MRVVILLAPIFMASASAMAGIVTVSSPDHPQTFAYGEVIWHQLYLDCAARGLSARITFSNLPYVGDDTPRTDEPFDFRFPGVQFDSAQRVFFARSSDGERIQVARFHRNPSFGWIDLAPGAKIYLIKQSGRVTAILTATDCPRAGVRWIEMDNNFSLQNLLIALLRELRVPPDS